jgi:hypothetical protein
MLRLRFPFSTITRPVAVALALLCVARGGSAQNTPLLSGGIGFLTNTNTGNTTYTPIIEPLIAAPIGSHVLVESRAALLETWSPRGSTTDPGYEHSHFVGLTYLQGDYIASRHLTVVGGSFLLPFGTYNERLSPIWIGNFQDGPSSSNIGLMSTGLGVGAQLRGSAISRRKYSFAYAGYFSARSGNEQFAASRSAGGRGSFYFPEQRLEVGMSYARLLQNKHENFFGTHLWWEPKDTGFRLRSEFNRGEHSQGYWMEFDYRMQAFGGPNSFIGRFEPLFRMQQTFRLDNSPNTDGVAAVNLQRADFGLDYNLPHNTRILTSYARQFASTGNRNIWETGIVYRFLFPTWKGK